jgi:hypothetical protein
MNCRHRRKTRRGFRLDARRDLYCDVPTDLKWKAGPFLTPPRILPISLFFLTPKSLPETEKSDKTGAKQPQSAGDRNRRVGKVSAEHISVTECEIIPRAAGNVDHKVQSTGELGPLGEIIDNTSHLKTILVTHSCL